MFDGLIAQSLVRPSLALSPFGAASRSASTNAATWASEGCCWACTGNIPSPIPTITPPISTRLACLTNVELIGVTQLSLDYIEELFTTDFNKSFLSKESSAIFFC
jgi:hypothetical protein